MLHVDINKLYVNLFMLHVDINKLYVNIIKLHVEIIYLTCTREKYATILMFEYIT